MNKNLFLSQEDRHSEESPLIYKWAKPVTALKAKRDADGFIAPWAMFRPLGDKGLFSAMLGENAVRRAADLRLNRDLLLKEIYEHEIEQLMCRVRLSEIETQQKFAKEDREMELYQQGRSQHQPKITSETTRKVWLDAITWKYDFIQRYKKRCFQFAEAVILRITLRGQDVCGNNDLMGNAEERAFITGDGVGKPLGLLAETGGAKVGVTAAQKDAVSFDEIFKLYYALKAPYRKKAQFLCNEALVLQLMTIKDNNGNYIWKPGLEIGKPDTLLNRPLKTSAFMPEIKGGSKVMAFGDYSYYWVADRQNRTFRRLNELYARTDQVGFLTTQRVDGKLILPEAVQLLQMAPQG